MSIRIVVVPLFDADADANSLGAAFDVARRFEAHVVGLYARPDARDVMPLIGEGMSRSVMDDLLRAAETELKERRDGARARFDAARAAAGVPLAEGPSPRPGAASAAWREVTGRPEMVVPEAARLADLVVFSRAESDGDPAARNALEATLLGGRRPILLLPPAAPERIGHNVAIAWNGGAEAAAAVAGAMPFLERAVAVHVLTAETRRTSAEASMGLAEYLEWHGVPSDRHPVAVEGGPVGAALLEAAGEAGADLVVMGGYGRTRLSELILGGVTRHVLAHAHLPVLMAH
jgi:nucleotide-binding universal stress UspA family protein